MAGPSDKARFYLEHSVAELNELQRKKIFTREEISSIAKRRSNFEHIINARGSQPSDYVRYVEFEKNVDALRRIRIKRLGVKSTGSGQRNIFFLYNRAVRKFSGDLDLWIQYVEFSKQEKAYKKLNEIFTSVVRLHPTKPNLWIYAAHYFMDTQADITNARSYMQRGLRFCKNSEHLWLEYAKLEALYIGKIAGRRRILGLDVDPTAKSAEDNADGDVIALPEITAEDVNPNVGKDDGVDQVALHNLASAPVLTGAVPLAIFDSAMKQFQYDPHLAEQFFDMFAEFDQVPCLERMLQYVLEQLQQHSPQSVSTTICEFRMQFVDIDATSPRLPSVLRSSFGAMDTAIQQHPKATARLALVAIRQVLPLLRVVEEADERALKKVLLSSLRKYSRLLEEAGNDTSGAAIVDIVDTLRRENNTLDAKRLLQASLKQYGANERLLQLRRLLDTERPIELEASTGSPV